MCLRARVRGSILYKFLHPYTEWFALMTSSLHVKCFCTGGVYKQCSELTTLKHELFEGFLRTLFTIRHAMNVKYNVHYCDEYTHNIMVCTDKCITHMTNCHGTNVLFTLNLKTFPVKITSWRMNQKPSYTIFVIVLDRVFRGI